MANFIPVLKTSDLPKGVKKAITASGKKIMVANVDGRYFAMDDACSHVGCPLATKGLIEGNIITCQCHGSKFDLVTGKVLAPPATIPMHVYTVKVEGENILVEV